MVAISRKYATLTLVLQKNRFTDVTWVTGPLISHIIFLLLYFILSLWITVKPNITLDQYTGFTSKVRTFYLFLTTYLRVNVVLRLGL